MFTVVLNLQYCYKSYGPGSSVGIATDYGLDGPGIESRWGRDFSHTSRPALGPTQPPVNVYRVFPGGKAAGAWCWRRGHERVELYLYSPFRPVQACNGSALYFIFYLLAHCILLRTRNFSDKIPREDQNTHFIFHIFFPKIMPLWGNMEEYCTARKATMAICYDNGTYGLHAGYLRLQTHTQNIHYILLYTGNNG
jgi:hypothetical protein